MKRIALLLLFTLLLTAADGLCQEAEEITALCTFRGSEEARLKCMTDGKYTSTWSSPGGRSATLRIESKTPIGSIYIQFYDTACAFDVQVRDAQGTWQKTAGCDTDFLTGYAVLSEPASEVRIVPQGTWGRLVIAEIHVFGVGEAPGWVQRWAPPLEKADLLVLSGHPDDEVLFMGGTIPYYAGERQMDVQVAYLVPATPYRKLELLDGLWLCGVRHYPDLGPFGDQYSLSLSGLYGKSGWSRDKVERYVVGLYRRYRPEVVVTHDVNGEYGHAVHRAAADAAQTCVALAADPAVQDRRLAETEPWQIQKLYLHLYEQGTLRMDWRQPLAAFDGRTALEMAEAAFACHISQQDTEYRVEDFGPYDNAVFGLAFSMVGEDEEKDDFFEHIGDAR